MRDDAVLGRALPLDRGLGPYISWQLATKITITEVQMCCSRSFKDFPNVHIIVTTHCINFTPAKILISIINYLSYQALRQYRNTQNYKTDSP